MADAVLITGSARRVGRAIALRFARDGWTVIVHYNSSADAAGELAREIRGSGGAAETVGFDLRDRAAVRAGADEVASRFPDWRALINNASVFEDDAPDNLRDDVWDTSIAVNALAPVLLAEKFAKLTKSGPDRCVVNMLDQKVENLNPDYFSYTVGKCALYAASAMMAMKFGAEGVRVVNIAPGLALPSGDQTQEEFEASSKLNLLGRATTLDDIVDAVAFAARSPAITGSTLFIDCGQHRAAQDRDVMFQVRGET